LSYRNQGTSLRAPYLRKVILLPDRVADWNIYPFNLPFFGTQEWELDFTCAVTVIVGENGTGKSTIVEAIAALAGYDEAGGGKGYRPVSHEHALDKSGAGLSDALRGHWLPKVTNGWFFRAESFYSVARYLDEAALGVPGAIPPDYLSWSHGEGFLRFFEERCSRQGIYFLDEPESALSPKRQLELLRILKRIQDSGFAQVIMATHSPLLMALPDARLLNLTRFGLDEIDFTQTEHFKLLRSFCNSPDSFILDALNEESA
jgi:predicted ATPase